MARRWSIVAGAILVLIGIRIIGDRLLDFLGLNFRIGWLFWPLVLIGVGVWIIQGYGRGGWKGGDVPREDASIPLDGATEAFIRIQHGAGRLSFSAGAAADLLLAGSFGGGLDARSTRDGGKLSVEMRIKERDVTRFIGNWGRGRHGFLDWDFKLRQGIPLSLVLETGANETRADMTDLMVSDVRLKTGASSTVMNLPARAGLTRVAVESGAASVKLRVPDGVAARIRVSSALSGITISAARFPRQGDYYVSADWDSAPNKADITVESGVGSIEVL